MQIEFDAGHSQHIRRDGIPTHSVLDLLHALVEAHLVFLDRGIPAKTALKLSALCQKFKVVAGERFDAELLAC